MRTNFFRDAQTAEQAKEIFHRLAKELHPDNGGDAEQFKAMRAEFEDVFRKVQNIHETKDGKRYEKNSKQTATEYADMIERMIHWQGVTIEIIGAWVWVSGDTKNYRDQLKAMRFFWSKSKKAWYFNGEEHKSRRRGHYSLDELRTKWGSEEVETEKAEAITAA